MALAGYATDDDDDDDLLSIEVFSWRDFLAIFSKKCSTWIHYLKYFASLQEIVNRTSL